MTTDLEESAETDQLTPETPAIPEPAIKHGWLRALLALMAFLAAMVAVSIGVGIIIAVTVPGDVVENMEKLKDTRNISPGMMAAIQAANLFGVLVVVLAFRRWLDRRSFCSLGLAPAWAHFGIGLIGGVVIIGASVAVLWTGGWAYLTMASPTITPLALMSYFAILVVVAFQEELFVRGYLLSNLMDSMPAPAALVVSASVFAVLHLGNANVSLLAFVNLALAGIALGVYYLHRRNLWFSIGMHLTWNFFQGPILGFEVSGITTPSIFKGTVSGSDIITGGPFGLEGSIVVTMLLIVTTVVIHLRYRDQPNTSPTTLTTS